METQVVQEHKQAAHRPRLRAHAEMPEADRSKQKHKRGSRMGSGCQTHRRPRGNGRPVRRDLQVSMSQTRYTSCWSQALIVTGHNLGEHLAPPTRLWPEHLLAGLFHWTQMPAHKWRRITYLNVKQNLSHFGCLWFSKSWDDKYDQIRSIISEPHPGMWVVGRGLLFPS